MYHYDQYDKAFVQARVDEFRDQVARRISGSLSDDEFKPLRLKNGLYLQLHAYMLRVAIPYGTFNAPQMRILAHIADKYDRGYGHITTRQNIQFNWIKLEEVPDILQDLANVEMHALQTSGNCIRNVTSDPFAGFAADELQDPRPVAEMIRQWSSAHPEFSYLPRKFKIAVAGGKDDRAITKAHDIGIRVVSQNGEIGYSVLVGGGLGRTPMIGKIVRDFLPQGQLLRYLEAVMRVYNAEGRRDNKYKARVKILVHELGLDPFKQRVEAEFALVNSVTAEMEFAELARLAAFFQDPLFAKLPTKSEILEKAKLLDKNFKAFVQNNTHPHKKHGYLGVTISLKPTGGIPGDISAAQMNHVANLAERFSFGEIRATVIQNLVLPHVRKDELYALWVELDALGLATANQGLITDIVACPGLDYCALATARSIPIAQAISERFHSLERQADIGELSIKISGCINACGHHHVGAIGILGLEKKGVENYQITLGGTMGNFASIGEHLGRGVNADEVPDIIEKLVEVYIKNRKKGESFEQNVIRIGLDPFKQAFVEEIA